jgi:hypothetical protein
METLKSEGAKEERFGIQGYKGEKFEGVALGIRESDNHAVLAVHGARTDSIAEWAIRENLDFACKRLDPAVIVEFTEPQPFYCEHLRQTLRAFEKSKGRKTRGVFTLFEKQTQDTGAYLGGRSSAVFPRIYDNDLYHHKKTQHLRWKHELELKGVAALHAWGQFKVSENRNQLCSDWVTTRLKKLGVCPRGLETMELVPLVGTKPPSEFEVWLQWLDRSVLPRIRRETLDGNGSEIVALLKKRGVLLPNGQFSMPREQQQEMEFDDDEY